ncbi:hypothetical protein FHR81_001315 [Actinoalloteichus hoggarensis]|uniref:Uncharacterized protein n=1 Tax=Actinoalloteichus hoggarensis TaxID=1470176 RepID=A0A221VZU4_9PSEU|nr:hypothetical protein [Actinoalloteichus hoggarensis]ASO19049.1 hypothetical protein AHOG_07005 [Actinoalloteichus hoggarensis]MBB5920285.1 hypothetical protein [Actinoalloteichus hoggarensis]
MSVATRLGAFLLAVAAAFGLAYAAGQFAGPVGEAPPPAHEAPGVPHDVHDPGR